jgi:hypothetical protein
LVDLGQLFVALDFAQVLVMSPERIFLGASGATPPFKYLYVEKSQLD